MSLLFCCSVWSLGGGVSRRVSCWCSREDRTAGDGTALAASSETGRERDNVGMAKDRANAANDGNEDDEEGRGGSGASLLGGSEGGSGVLGGGGLDTEVIHASRAASSSKFASGSN